MGAEKYMSNYKLVSISFLFFLSGDLVSSCLRSLLQCFILDQAYLGDQEIVLGKCSPRGLKLNYLWFFSGAAPT